MENEKRVEQLEKRIQKLESEVEVLKDALQQTNSSTTTFENSQLLRNPQEKKQLPVPVKKEPIDWEKAIAVWLPRIFIFVLLLGVVWGFTAAINAGIITEPVRCILGVLVSVALVFVGEKQIKEKREALGQVLIGGAVAIGIFTVFATHVLYGFIPAPVAFILDVMLIVMGLWMSEKHKAQALAVVASVGGYMVPFLIKSDNPSTLFFVSYETILSVTFLLLSLKRKYSVLYYSSLSLFHVTLFIFAMLTSQLQKNILFAGILIQHVSLIAYLVFSEKTKAKQLASLFASFAITIGWGLGLLEQTNYEVFLIASAIAYIGLSIWLKVNDNEKTIATLCIGLFSIMLYILDAFKWQNQTIPLVLEGGFAIMLAMKYRNWMQIATGSVIYLIGAFETFFKVIQDIFSLDTASWIVLIVSLIAFYQVSLKEAREERIQSIRKVYLSFSKVFIISITALLLIFLTECTNVLAKGMSIDSQHMAVSFVWALYAIAGIVYGIMKDSKSSKIIGTSLLFVTLLKLVFVDLPSVSIAVRAILFMVIGGAGVAVSRLFYKK